MKSIKLLFLAVLAAFSVTMYSCETEGIESRESVLELPTTPFSYQMGSKDELPTLGRVLFYDVRLSANNSVSCASCHKQAIAFTDNRRFSLGFQNKLTTRNSMAIQNIVSSTFLGGPIDSLGFGGVISPGGIIIEPNGSLIVDPGFQPFVQPTALFWDGRNHDLPSMVMEPIQNHIEMGVNNLDNLATKVAAIGEYQTLFASAFDDGVISKEHIANALSAFLVSIRSNQSRFDASLNGSTQLTALEQFGMDLFFDKYDCNSCHQLQAPFNGYQLAGDGGMADIGLDEEPVDGGVFRVTGNASDKGKFKIPSLRNIALTAPYMHDGRFATLEDVIEHYSVGIEGSENLDERLRNTDESARKFNIPNTEKRAIVAFLHTMTDPHLIGDPKFSNPFKVK
jgi:cytochrome c peroxidase